MTKRSLAAFLAVLAWGATMAPAHAAGDVEAGQVKAIPCMGCHGIPGYFNVYPTYHVPKVGGQNAAYIVEALKGYKSGARGHKTMRAQAASLSEQDMQDIAAFFAGFKEGEQ